MTVLNVSAEFSPYLGGRYRSHGPWSGEQFREDYLVPRLDQAIGTGEQLIVQLDGVAGVPSSFLEEAFGGLVRTGRFTPQQLASLITLEANDPELWPYLELAKEFIQRAEERLH